MRVATEGSVTDLDAPIALVGSGVEWSRSFGRQALRRIGVASIGELARA